MTFKAVSQPQPSYLLTRRLFLRFLGLCFFVAFVAMGGEVLGLCGSEGILPVQTFLADVKKMLGWKAYVRLPTLCWFSGSDPFLLFLCWGGAALSLGLVANVAPRLTVFLLWVFYLSLNGVAGSFMEFQWDSLLLETGFLAIFLAPRHLLRKNTGEDPPSRIAIWLLRWLLFRLMFESGMVKLLSGDETWRDLTALTYHYMTQPLPNVVSWYVHQLPVWFHQISAAMVFLVELAAPLLMFCGRRARGIVFFLFAGFQTLIILTGNYCFFNYLTMALCLLLLDDDLLRKILPDRLTGRLPDFVADERKGRGIGRIVLAGWAILVLILSSVQIFPPVFAKARWLQKPLNIVQGWLAPFQMINGYGLFASMTTRRPEIIVEGSRDGTTWQAYEFKWKPGKLDRAPGWVAPFHPRLDWQMWFAALTPYQRNPWFLHFLERLLTGSPAVLGLLEHNPFPGNPPRYIRAVRYEYDFTDPESKQRTGAWWQRKPVGPYCPVLSLEN